MFTRCSSRCSSSASSGEYGSQLLTLSAELSEKELQLVEAQQQHNRLICRSTDAFQRLEAAIRTKDQVIWQLHQALQCKQDELQRQEKLLNNRSLLRHHLKGSIEHKNLEIAELKVQTARQAQDLEESEHVVAKLKSLLQEQEKATAQLNEEIQEKEKAAARLNAEIQEKEKSVAGVKAQLQEKEKAAAALAFQVKEKEKSACQHQHLQEKVKMLSEQVKSLNSRLSKTGAELQSEKQLCNELKVSLRKKENLITQHEFAEEQLRSAFMRQTEAYNALEAFKDKLQEEKMHSEKNTMKLKEEIEALGSLALSDHQLQEEFEAQEACIATLKKQIQDLHDSIQCKDTAFVSQSRKLQLQYNENQRLFEDLERVKQELKDTVLAKAQLESSFRYLDDDAGKCHVDVEDPTFHHDDSSNQGQEIVEVCSWKPHSVYEETPSRKGALPALDGRDKELLSIEEEIGRREREWRQTEAKMRAELCRRVAQLCDLEAIVPKEPFSARLGSPHMNSYKRL